MPNTKMLVFPKFRGVWAEHVTNSIPDVRLNIVNRGVVVPDLTPIEALYVANATAYFLDALFDLIRGEIPNLD